MRLLAELAYFEENPTQSTRARFFPLFGASVNRSRDGENRMKGAKRQIERMELKKKKHIFFFKWHERKRIFLFCLVRCDTTTNLERSQFSCITTNNGKGEQESNILSEEDIASNNTIIISLLSKNSCSITAKK